MSHPSLTSSGQIDISSLLAAPADPLPYRVWLRGLDVLSGRRDGARRLAGSVSTLRLTEDQTAWLRANAHRCNERLHSEDLIFGSLAMPMDSRAREVGAAIEIAHQDLATAQERYDTTLADHPDVGLRQVTESHLSHEQVAERRRREYALTVVKPARSKLQEARDNLDALLHEQHRIQAALSALAQVTESRKERLTEFHERRGHAYERAYLRRATGTPNRG